MKNLLASNFFHFTSFIEVIKLYPHYVERAKYRILKCLVLFFIVPFIPVLALSRSITLTKTGGGTLYFTAPNSIPAIYSNVAGFIMPTFTNGNHTMTFTESTLNASKNWTEEFQVIAKCINMDVVDNISSGVSYKIDIDAPSASNPMIVGRQDLITGTEFALSSNAMLFSGILSPMLITTTNQQAHIKYENDLYYGSWIAPGQTLTYYEVLFPNQVKVNTTLNTLALWNTYLAPSLGTPLTTTPIPIVYPTTTSSTAISVATIPTTFGSYWSSFYELHARASVGYFFQAQNCSNITIEKLAVNGNSEHALIGGIYGDAGIQNEYTGVYFYNCKDSKIQNCKVHSMGLDGMKIEGSLTNNIDIDNCQFEYNGRQALSWIAGNDISATNQCHFSHSGKAFNIHTQHTLASTPSAGLGIEPACIPNTNICDYCTNGVFTDCYFEDNVGCPVSNDVVNLASDITFTNCHFYDSDKYGLLVRAKNVTYNECDIYCRITASGDGVNAGEETKYIDCNFEDKPFTDINSVNHYWDDNYKLLDLVGYYRTHFENCTFKVNDIQREFAYLKTGPVNNTSEYSTIKNCTFIYNNVGYTNNDMNLVPTFIEGVVFKGNNSVINNMQTPYSFHNFQTAYAIVEGSPNACEPNILEFSGRISHCINSNPSNNIQLQIGKQNGGILDGYAKYILHNEAQSCVNTNNNINIGKFSSIQVENNASFNCGNSTIEVNGQMIQEANSYLEMKNGATFTTTSTTPLLYIDQACNPGGNTLNPIWGPCLGGNMWYGTIPFPQLCVQGNHPTLSANACSAPLYNNISTNGAFSIMYNTTNNLCNGASAGSIYYLANGNAGAMSYTLNGGAPTTATSFTGLTAGLYTLVATDASCTSNNVSIPFQIMQPLTPISITSATSTNITCNNANDGTINVLASGGTGTISYNLQPSNSNNTTGSFTSLVANAYTVSATDVNGCSITTTLTISNPTAVSITSAAATNITCNNANDGSINVLASGGTGAISYNLQPTNANNTTGNFNGLTANTYTITATDANGCSITTSIILINPNPDYCCNTDFGSASNKLFFDNTTASNFSTNLNFTNSSIFINGIYTIDQNMNFSGCTFFFTANAKITVNTGYTLTIDDCTLKAGCSNMWDGIYASDPSSQIVITNSTIQDMENGVVSSNDAKLNIVENIFIDNYVGMQIVNSPIGYNFLNGECMIRKNTFTSSGLSLLPPHNINQFKGEIGISIQKCQEVEVGYIDAIAPNPSEMNTFNNLYTGIYSVPAKATLAQNLKFNNNTFSEIKDDTYTGLYIENQKLLNAYSSLAVGRRGAGIYFQNYDVLALGLPLNLHHATIIHLDNGGEFNGCDKAIIGHSISAEINGVHVNNTMLGLMFTDATNQQYRIYNNALHETLLGIQCIGDIGNSSLSNNEILTESGPILTGYNNFAFPVGIDIKNGNNFSVSNISLMNNPITLASICGVGINLSNTGKNLLAYNNTIDLTSTTSASAYANYTAAGINLSNCKGSNLERNTITGNTSLLLNANQTKGIQMNTSKECRFTCNATNKMPIGWNVISNCYTPPDHVQGNSFDAHYIGMLYRHLGSEGTLGNIGDNQNDNNNSFHGTSYMSDQNYNGYTDKIYRMSGCIGTALGDNIFTNSSTLNSYCSISNCSPLFDAITYACNIQANPSADIYSCPIIQIIEDGGADDESINENSAILVAQNNITYPEFQEIAKWFDERNVYEGLDKDSIIRNSNIIFNNFYYDQQQKSTDDILTTNRNLSSFIDSTLATDSTQITQRILNTQTSNNTISTTRIYEENERDVNGYYLRWITKGIDDLSNTEKGDITTLALSCPYVNGTAVYKARMINASMNPLVDYNDLLLCNAAGVYKNTTGTGLFDEENSWLNSISNSTINNVVDKVMNQTIQENKFEIYPNPASTVLKIAYQLNEYENGELILFDIIGKEQLRISLSNKSNNVIVNIQNLFKGIYTYKYVINNISKSTGKITIE